LHGRDAVMDLFDVFKNASQLKVLRLSAGYDQFLTNVITSATQSEHLVQVEFGLLYTDASVFGPFIAKNLLQVEVLIIAEGCLLEGSHQSLLYSSSCTCSMDGTEPSQFER